MDEAFQRFFSPLPHRCCTLKLAPDYSDTLKRSRGHSAKRSKTREADSRGVRGAAGAAVTSRRSRARTMLAVKGDYL